MPPDPYKAYSVQALANFPMASCIHMASMPLYVHAKSSIQHTVNPFLLNHLKPKDGSPNLILPEPALILNLDQMRCNAKHVAS